MLTMSDGLISAVELDYEKNEVLGLTEQDNFRLLMKKWLLTRQEVLNIVRKLSKPEEDLLGELI
jgi:hypothetical protein|tara:strand:- start:143 stop:334 length:192 start_codon:yes stop_codon:yes gene_type:complete